MIAVSACLIGVNCRYNGGNSLREEVLREGRILIPFCPEQLGGLPTPREPAEIVDGDGRDVLEGRTLVRTIEGGRDLTENFLRGAREALYIMERLSIDEALLKEGSPSCGVRRIVRGGLDVEGMGVTAALFVERGISVRGIE